jgi:hypothetical protein
MTVQPLPAVVILTVPQLSVQGGVTLAPKMVFDSDVAAYLNTRGLTLEQYEVGITIQIGRNVQAYQKAILSALSAIQTAVGPKPVAGLTLRITGETKMAAFMLPDDGTPGYGVATPVDKAGNPTTDPASLTWSSSDPTVATVTPPVAPLLAATIVAAVPAPAIGKTCQISVTDGTFTATGDVQIIAGAVAGLSIGFSSTQS